MVREFGYTRDEMLRHTMKARSYWAQPMFSGERFVGVIYLFSTEPQAFPLSVDLQSLSATAGNIVAILEVATII